MLFMFFLTNKWFLFILRIQRYLTNPNSSQSKSKTQINLNWTPENLKQDLKNYHFAPEGFESLLCLHWPIFRYLSRRLFITLHHWFIGVAPVARSNATFATTRYEDGNIMQELKKLIHDRYGWLNIVCCL